MATNLTKKSEYKPIHIDLGKELKYYNVIMSSSGLLTTVGTMQILTNQLVHVHHPLAAGGRIPKGTLIFIPDEYGVLEIAETANDFDVTTKKSTSTSKKTKK